MGPAPESGDRGASACERARWLWPAVLALLLAQLTGCAQLVPQTVALRSGWPSGVPERAEISQVPFFPQVEYQCGPAALATVLAHSGVAITPEPLVSQVWLPSRRGSLQLEMLAAPRRYGRVSHVLAPRFADLLREVAAGNPVVVLQDVGLIGTQWHYAVVNGYEYASGTIYLRSDTRPRLEMPFTAFERSWMKGGYWAMVALPPDRIAATATEAGRVDAVLALAQARREGDGDLQRAWAATLERWPDNLPAAIGLANQHHARGELQTAAEVLGQARRRHPDSVIVMNNLARTLSDMGQHARALDILLNARGDLAQAFSTELNATRALIEERVRKESGNAGHARADPDPAAPTATPIRRAVSPAPPAPKRKKRRR